MQPEKVNTVARLGHANPLQVRTRSSEVSGEFSTGKIPRIGFREADVEGLAARQEADQLGQICIGDPIIAIEAQFCDAFDMKMSYVASSEITVVLMLVVELLLSCG